MLLPGRSLTLVELGIAQEEGAVENSKDPAEGQQVKYADRAQQRPIKPRTEQQDTAVKPEQVTPQHQPPSFTWSSTCSLQVPSINHSSTSLARLPTAPIAGCLTWYYSLGRNGGVLPVQYTVHCLAAAAHPTQEPLQLDQAANETSQSQKNSMNNPWLPHAHRLYIGQAGMNPDPAQPDRSVPRH